MFNINKLSASYSCYDTWTKSRKEETGERQFEKEELEKERIISRSYGVSNYVEKLWSK